jgi:DNA-binding winged helix-turn-helix (wHTH) protein
MRIRFGPFTLDLDTRQLTRADREIHLEPKAFELLSTLVLERPKAMSKAALQERLWPGVFVAEANLSNLVAEIRAALNDAARAPRFVRTAHRFGYAFCGDAVLLTDRGETAPARLWCGLEANGRRFPLPRGESVIGRDADVEIRFDTSTVSRRHARVVVTADAAVLEDCDSKNGTFRGDERVTSPIVLADGDTIRVGSVRLTFHVSAPFGATETHEGAPPWP